METEMMESCTTQSIAGHRGLRALAALTLRRPSSA
jgi:hypothetical protein